ncbi:MAG: site-specific integrase [Chitinophagales bacterium]|nr:site-specific integrase [Chitinophagales bacterium]
MISVKIILDTRSRKKDGTSPLKLRFIFHGQTYHKAMGYSIDPKHWNETGQKVKHSCKSIGSTTRFNALIHSQKQKALDVITRLDERGQLKRLSFPEIKKHLIGNQTDLMLLAYGEEVIARIHKTGKHGNARVYQLMLNSVRNFVKSKDIPMRQLSYRWLKRYEEWFLGKGNSINGLAVNLRTLRALINRAIKEKLLSKEYYPFNEYVIKREKTRKRAIRLEDIKKIKAFEPQTARQKYAQDCFLISFYLMGASFVDIAHLTLGHIIDNRIEYKRRKTGRLHSIILSKPLQDLLNPYLKNKTKEDYILNVIQSDDPQRHVNEVHNGLRRFNIGLKEIGGLCNIQTPLTSYVARHSYATIAKYKGIPTAVISEALGHSSEDVTQIYLDSFDKDVLDNYHQRIIE